MSELEDMDPVVRVEKYLRSRERAGLVHRNVASVWQEGRVFAYITTRDLRELLAEIKDLRTELTDLYDEMDGV